MNAFTHYANHGYNEKRDIQVSAGPQVGRWDNEGYLRLHPDVRAANMDAWSHYMNHGHKENRPIVVISASGQPLTGRWDQAGYYQLHPDVQKAGMNSFEHWKNVRYSLHNRAALSAPLCDVQPDADSLCCLLFATVCSTERTRAARSLSPKPGVSSSLCLRVCEQPLLSHRLSIHLLARHAQPVPSASFVLLHRQLRVAFGSSSRGG
jgi:hypothetical protein